MKRLEISPGFVAFTCFLFYISPTAVFWPFLLFSVLHELGHLGVLILCAVPVRRVSLGSLGTVIETGPLSAWAEALCALAGPAVNFFCFWTLHPLWPEAALISLILGSYNLLPIYPLDGGRALRVLLSWLLPLPVAMWGELAVSALTVGLLCLGMLCLLPHFGWAPLLCGGLLLGRLAWEQKFLLRIGKNPGIIR